MRPRVGLSSVAAGKVERAGPVKDNGDASRPMRKASEKLRVASVARNIPSRTRDMHCVRRSC